MKYDGKKYIIAGGAPIYINDWNAVGGPQNATTLTTAQWNTLRKYPKDGTFIKANRSNGAAGTNSFVIAGGAPVYVSEWNAVGGQPSTVTLVDTWSTTHTADARTHLRAAPLDDTALRTIANQLYTVTSGMPNPVGTASGTPTTVDQYSINLAISNGYWPLLN